VAIPGRVLGIRSCKAGWLSPPGVEVSSDGQALAPGLQSGVAVPEPMRMRGDGRDRLVSCKVGWLSPPGVEVSSDGQVRVPGLQSGVAIPEPMRCAVTAAIASSLAK
jgi:hypothetical protein